MATLEDKILGDHKRDNYCSSSEDEDDNNAFVDASDTVGSVNDKTHLTEIDQWSGSATNTGPKGVIKDWQRFKQLESEKQEQKTREQLELMKKLSITARTTAEDALRAEQDALDAEMAELMNDDSILLRFQQERMREMLNRCGHKLKVFGEVIPLANGDDFLTAIDKEDKLITVIVHIYENKINSCKTLNRCIDELAQSYKHVKFCKIIGSAAGMSQNFKMGGIPALLVYRNGNLVGNFVRISKDLGGDDFFTSDLEGFLIENGMLPDKSHVPAIINNGNKSEDDD